MRNQTLLAGARAWGRAAAKAQKTADRTKAHQRGGLLRQSGSRATMRKIAPNVNPNDRSDGPTTASSRCMPAPVTPAEPSERTALAAIHHDRGAADPAGT